MKGLSVIRGNSKTTLILFLSLMFAAVVLFVSATDPVWAEGKKDDSKPNKIDLLEDQDSSDDSDTESSIHEDVTTFQKNWELTNDQKILTIEQIEEMVGQLNDDMSDLEKYYTLASLLNQHVDYDGDFWDGKYNFDYYSHQWDSYGVLEEQKAVCVGIAVCYSTLCHAADLPCRIARLDPKVLDHTINYIPDINGNPYYIDVTENLGLMSYDANPFNMVDKEFAKITKECEDHTFDYLVVDGKYSGSSIYLREEDSGEKYYPTYDEWFTEYALHENTDKKFDTIYEEKGSGLPGFHNVSYSDYEPNFREKPGIWFLDDFYEDPEAVKTKIEEGNVINEELITLTDLKENYDCNDLDELKTTIEDSLKVSYFPSKDEKGNIVAQRSAPLTLNDDYTIEVVEGEQPNTAKVTISGKGNYKGVYALDVTTNSAVVTKAPVGKEGLVYNGEPQDLVDPGEAEDGAEKATMLYAIGTKDKPGTFKETTPKAKNAGKYYVWYKAKGAEGRGESKPQRMDKTVSIAPKEVKVSADDIKIKVGESVTVTPELDTKIAAEFNFISTNKKVATTDDENAVKGIGEGTAVIFIDGACASPNYEIAEEGASFRVNVVKAENPMTLKGKTVKIKYKKLKKKSKKIKRPKAITVSKAKGKVSYKLVSAKKGKKNFKKKFRVNAKTGKITVKKGLKKGTYKVKVKVKAGGNQSYSASPWKNVTFKVKVK